MYFAEYRELIKHTELRISGIPKTPYMMHDPVHAAYLDDIYMYICVCVLYLYVCMQDIYMCVCVLKCRTVRHLVSPVQESYKLTMSDRSNIGRSQRSHAFFRRVLD